MATLFIIAGPNGIGKSTLSQELSAAKDIKRIDPDYIFQFEFTNPDTSYFPYYLSGKIDLLFESDTSFILESNFHNHEAFGILNKADQNRFKKNLLFISTDHIKILEERVLQRSGLGLHYVPTEEIIRRYKASLQLLPQYIDDFDKISFYDGSPSLPEAPIHLVDFEAGRLVSRRDKVTATWFNNIIKRWTGQTF